MNVVLDTNVVLDLWLFHDNTWGELKALLQARQLRWLATRPMRDELAAVLTYPHLQQRMQVYGRSVDEVLGPMDALVGWQDVAPRAPYVCKDPDDQKFIDLCVAHQAVLLSKDLQVLKLRNRLARLGCQVAAQWLRPQPGLH